jgi:phosphoglycolate phosphatase-like HAD superfamily hydrolase
MSEERSILVLWDVDHTLIETRGVGAELYKAGFEEAIGVEMKQKADVTGATEPEIFAETMRLNGLTVGVGDEDRYADALARQYESNRKELRRRGRALPGASEALAAVRTMAGVVQSVLTGNLKRVAEVKLETFGLRELLDLDVAAYGEDADDRPGLVLIAQTAATQKYGRPYDRTNTLLIGDSQSDIRTAQEGGAYVIGVASGKATQEELDGAGADSTLRDLTDVTALMEEIENVLK